MSSDTAPAMIEFTPEDLQAAVMLIDLACQQGAFRGWENIEKAYTVRERLLAFANQWQAAVTPTPSTDTGEA